MNRLRQSLIAKYRGFTPIACLNSPRPDILRGFARWQWLYRRRKSGALIDPSVEVRHDFQASPELDSCLRLARGSAIDRGCILWVGKSLDRPGELILDEDAYIGPYTFLGSCHRLVIGRNVMVGAHSYVITVNHRTADRDIPYRNQGYEGGDIIIGSNAWLGCHVVVLPGVTIGENAIIGAGAVVTKDVPAGETWAGVPARKIKG